MSAAYLEEFENGPKVTNMYNTYQDRDRSQDHHVRGSYQWSPSFSSQNCCQGSSEPDVAASWQDAANVRLVYGDKQTQYEDAIKKNLGSGIHLNPGWCPKILDYDNLHPSSTLVSTNTESWNKNNEEIQIFLAEEKDIVSQSYIGNGNNSGTYPGLDVPTNYTYTSTVREDNVANASDRRRYSSVSISSPGVHEEAPLTSTYTQEDTSDQLAYPYTTYSQNWTPSLSSSVATDISPLTSPLPPGSKTTHHARGQSLTMTHHHASHLPNYIHDSDTQHWYGVGSGSYGRQSVTNSYGQLPAVQANTLVETDGRYAFAASGYSKPNSTISMAAPVVNLLPPPPVQKYANNSVVYTHHPCQSSRMHRTRTPENFTTSYDISYANQPRCIPGAHTTEFGTKPDLYEKVRKEQSAPPLEDMDPEDPDLKPYEQEPRFEGDLYTPRWVRGHGNKREGWCGICAPGRWLILKNSAYWYDKSFSHGISAASGATFKEPMEIRRMDGNPEVWEGLCHSCHDWFSLVSNKKKGTTWFRHAFKCHSHIKATIKDAPKRKREGSQIRVTAPLRRKLKQDAKTLGKAKSTLDDPISTIT